MNVENIVKGKISEYTGVNAFANFKTVETAIAITKRLSSKGRWMSSLGGLDFMNDKNPYTSIKTDEKMEYSQFKTQNGVQIAPTGFSPKTATLDFYNVIEEQADLGLYQSLAGLMYRCEPLRWLCANSSEHHDLGFWYITSINKTAETLGEHGLEFEQRLTVSLIKTIAPETEFNGAGVFSAIF